MSINYLISEIKKEKQENLASKKFESISFEDENSFDGLLRRLDEDQLKIIVQLNVIKRGKRVTNIKGFTDERQMASIAHELKKTIGTGGTSKNGIIVLQGDHRTKVTEFLKSMGFSEESIEVI
ncbi:MAG: translation initiation factor [Candidatus Nitrosocosmicus sp.]|uniref:translation initiation factor n=1 Tax=Candidatus Nitrosocosmicus agrestis TaxID=2563600 RepID=UPI001331BF21|nr:translation initiation factor [Candidatus Nitrosocosmicus sp. SS]MDR4490113.1 translation initiation factor [Candidatus Nitrosocosmicus sp.]HET6590917.1 translation initiation factor [Candidatus Nitrosocosmicus sp.]